jgi:hypothetical protein
MNSLPETSRRVFRTLLLVVMALCVLRALQEPTDYQTSPLCFTVAVAGLACSCRPIEPKC